MDVVKKSELSIHKAPVENLFVFDKSKGVVFYNTNNKVGSVSDTARLKGHNYIDTHNHPNKYGIANPFSGADISTMLDLDRGEMRVCSYGYIYRMRNVSANPKQSSYYQGQWNRKAHKIMKDAPKLYGEFEYIDGEPLEKTKIRRDKYLRELEIYTWKEVEKALEQFCNQHGFWYKKEKLQ